MAAVSDDIPLSPWPTTPAARARAVARLRGALGKAANPNAWPEGDGVTAGEGTPDETDYELHRIAQTASGRIEGYGGNAPQAARDEAVIRTVAYLIDTQGAQRLVRVSGLAVRIPDSAQGWLRHSGAMAILAPYRPRYAAATGAE